MKRLAEGILLAVAMVAVVLCVSPADAQKGDEAARRDVVYVSLREVADFEGFDVEARGGEVVGLTVVQKGGRRQALRRQSQPPCEAACPAGERLSCWEDESRRTGVCVCDGGAERKVSGQKKYTNIVLKRGADTSR